MLLLTAGAGPKQRSRRRCPVGDIAAVTIERRGVARQLSFQVAEGHGRAAPISPIQQSAPPLGHSQSARAFGLLVSGPRAGDAGEDVS